MRTILVEGRSAPVALRKARERGKREELQYEDGGTRVLFEFIGVAELIDLGASDEDEVWWEFFEMVRPMERRDVLIPKDKDLRAFSVGSERAARRAANRRSR